MDYSDTTNKNGLMQDFEITIGAADGQITGNVTKKAQVTGFFNQMLHQAQIVIFDSLDGWDFDDVNHTDYPILTANLVANQKPYRFAQAEQLIKIKRVQVTYDGVNWYKAVPFDQGESGLDINTTESEGRFDTTKPFYDMRGDSMYLYPTPTTTANDTAQVKVWVDREMDEFVVGDTTQQPGIDKAFHRYISLGSAVKWAIIKRLSNRKDLKQEFMELEGRMRVHYSNKIDDDNLQLKPAYINYD